MSVTTDYVYTALDQLTSVTMTRDGATQTRTAVHDFDRVSGGYGWDNEGRLTASDGVTYQYDEMGRLSTLDNGTTARATYGAAGEMLTLWVTGMGTETRSYNGLLQIGRTVQSKDWVSGEEVTYTYDALQRLAKAATTGPAKNNYASAYDQYGASLEWQQVGTWVVAAGTVADRAFSVAAGTPLNPSDNSIRSALSSPKSFHGRRTIPAVCADLKSAGSPRIGERHGNGFSYIHSDIIRE